MPTTSAPTIDQALTLPAPVIARPRTRLTLPATTPLRNVTCCGVIWSMREVTLLSSPQQAHAPTINRALRLVVAPGSQTRMTPAAVTSSAAAIMFRPRCSRNSVAASTTVVASSMFNSSDAVAAGVSTSPAVNNAGPIAPPATIATANAPSSRRSAPIVGRWAIHHGETANAAPRYNSPASINGRHVFGEDRRRRCRRTEQQRRQRAVADPRSSHHTNGNRTARTADLAHGRSAPAIVVASTSQPVQSVGDELAATTDWSAVSGLSLRSTVGWTRSTAVRCLRDAP